MVLVISLLFRIFIVLYVRMVIFIISENVLYDFHYSYMMQKFAWNKIKLLYTDTYSLIYEIQCEAHEFDTSDYPSDNLNAIELKNRKKKQINKTRKGELWLNMLVYVPNFSWEHNYFLTTQSQTNCVLKAIYLKNVIVKFETQNSIVSKLHEVY